MHSPDSLVILVSAEPDSVMGRHVLPFCLAALYNYTLQRIFFYGAGVYHAQQRFPPPDEMRPEIRWQPLVDAGVDLVVCVSAALRRGVLDTEQALLLQQPGATLLPGFRLGGLAELAESYHIASRRLHFPST